jgi:quercetin dioxygenase-like cupin family protein
MSRPQAVPAVQDENEFTRVTEWRFAPGAETGWHIHEYAYVVVPMLEGTLRIENRNGDETTAQLSHGLGYSNEAGDDHNVINASDHEFYFVEVEFKDRPIQTC